MIQYCFKCNLKKTKDDSWYGVHKECFKRWFRISSLEHFQDVAARFEPDLNFWPESKNSTFFHGKFRKYSSTLAGTKYILKVEEKEYPELPATEYLCNQIFKQLNIEIPAFYLIDFAGFTCFATENFMGSLSQSSLVHFYHFLKDNDKYNCESMVSIIGENVGRITAQEDFVYLTLADSLIGNNDRHGRNLGFISSSKGYRLSPFYDNVSYLGIELEGLLEADHQPKGAIETLGSCEPTMKEYVNEWERLGFAYVVERFRKVLSLKKIQKLIKNSYLTPKRQKAISRVINKRSSELWQ